MVKFIACSNVKNYIKDHISTDSSLCDHNYILDNFLLHIEFQPLPFDPEMKIYFFLHKTSCNRLNVFAGWFNIHHFYHCLKAIHVHSYLWYTFWCVKYIILTAVFTYSLHNMILCIRHHLVLQMYNYTSRSTSPQICFSPHPNDSIHSVWHICFCHYFLDLSYNSLDW